MADLRTAPRPSDTPAPPPYRRSRGPLIALVVLLIIGVAAAVFLVVTAGDDDAPSQPLGAPGTATTSVPPTTLDPEAATKAEIEAAYRQSWDAFLAVASDPDGQVDDARLTRYKKGTALAAAQLTVRRMRAEGHVLDAIRQERNPRVVQLSPDAAVVEDCGIDVSAMVDQQTGEVIEPAGPPEPKLVVADFDLTDGRWMQSTFTATKQPCVLSE